MRTHLKLLEESRLILVHTCRAHYCFSPSDITRGKWAVSLQNAINWSWHILVSSVLLALHAWRVCIDAPFTTELGFYQYLIRILTKISHFLPECIYREEKLRPVARGEKTGFTYSSIGKRQRVALLWPIYHRADRPTRSARWIKVKAKVWKMTAACENWHTRLFKLGPGEPKHKITSIPAALRGTVGKCDQQQHNNGEAGRGEGRSY